MITLCISTSGQKPSVAIARDQSILSYREIKFSKVCNEISDSIKSMIEQANISGFDQIDSLAIDNGPGSFNGIRAGLAYANGLALLSQYKIYAISSLKLLFYTGYCNKKASFRKIKTVIHAREDEFFCLEYDVESDSFLPEKVVELENENDCFFICNNEIALNFIPQAQLSIINLDAHSFSKIENIEKYRIRENFVNANYIKNPYITKPN